MQMDLSNKWDHTTLFFVGAVVLSAILHGVFLVCLHPLDLTVHEPITEFGRTALTVSLNPFNKKSEAVIQTKNQKDRVSDFKEAIQAESRQVEPIQEEATQVEPSHAPMETTAKHKRQKVGLEFRPKLKRQLERQLKQTEHLRLDWQPNHEPLMQKGDALLWTKNGCFEITDNEDGFGQTFQFSSKCPTKKAGQINLDAVLEAIKPAYGEFAR